MPSSALTSLALIVGARPIPFTDLEAMARDLVRLAGSPRLHLKAVTAYLSGERSGFPAVKCETPAGEWIATATLLGRPLEDLQRALGRLEALSPKRAAA